jgi:two-component system response regulator
MKNKKLAELLLVDDDEGDIMLTEECLLEGRMHINLHAVHDGIAAMQYLRQEGPYAQALRPDIILLDLNMPKMDGRETLKAIKSDVKLRSIPVVILTTSEDEFDVNRCYEIGANCYITKPVGFEAFKKVVNSIEDFWFTIVKVPSD